MLTTIEITDKVPRLGRKCFLRELSFRDVQSINKCEDKEAQGIYRSVVNADGTAFFASPEQILDLPATIIQTLSEEIAELNGWVATTQKKRETR